jgi:hypothetical protein
MRALGAIVALLAIAAPAAGADYRPPAAGLELREITRDADGIRQLAETGVPIPADAVRVFTYEGGPSNIGLGFQAVCVGDGEIAVDYGRSGVVFDRKTGRVVRRVTVADGWPRVRPQGFPPAPEHKDFSARLAGPGLLDISHNSNVEYPPYTPAATAEFAGRTWRAMQPTDFSRKKETPAPGEAWSPKMTWSGVLRDLSAQSFVEAAAPGGQAVRYTEAEGLPGNIVTHLAAAQGTLWAACADIYDAEKGAWGTGGLARFDERAGCWQRIAAVDGHAVRWVTLLQAVGDDLWIGFREAEDECEGVTGDHIFFGMGIYVGQYRPNVRSISLARLSGGKWTVFPRDLASEYVETWDWPSGYRHVGEPPTEVPRQLARVGDRIFLFSDVASRGEYGGWDWPHTGSISVLDLAAGTWRVFDLEKDFGVYAIHSMIAERGEVLASTDRGLFRWTGERWTLLDTGSPIRNSNMSAVVRVGGELWVGYTNQAFGVLGEQGISRYDEASGRWSHFSPNEIGTGSPVQTILPTATGEVWVLFMHRPWEGSMREWPRYRQEGWRSPEGLGRFAAGRWEFPAILPGVPETITGQYQDAEGVLVTYSKRAYIPHLAVVSDRVFVANATGAYAGPKEWKKIVDGYVAYMQPTKDGKSLEIVRDTIDKADGRTVRTERGLYDLASGKVEFKRVDPNSHEWDRLMMPFGRVLRLRRQAGENPDAEPPMNQDWTALPKRGSRQWAVGDLGPDNSAEHRVVETPAAVWLVSDGELIRLDRQRLKTWLGEP